MGQQNSYITLIGVHEIHCVFAPSSIYINTTYRYFCWQKNFVTQKTTKIFLHKYYSLIKLYIACTFQMNGICYTKMSNVKYLRTKITRITLCNNIHVRSTQLLGWVIIPAHVYVRGTTHILHTNIHTFVIGSEKRVNFAHIPNFGFKTLITHKL